MMVTPKTIKCTKETETREEVEEEAMMENIPEEIDNTKERIISQEEATNNTNSVNMTKIPKSNIMKTVGKKVGHREVEEEAEVVIEEVTEVANNLTGCLSNSIRPRDITRRVVKMAKSNTMLTNLNIMPNLDITKTAQIEKGGLLISTKKISLSI